MAIQSLTQALALSGGHPVWMVPNAEKCPWTRRLDWYLNFQWQRAKSHKKRELDFALKEILVHEEHEIKKIEIPAKAPLMVASQNVFPNEKTIHVPFRENIAEWVSDCQKIWRDLGSPSVRLFLPYETSIEEIESLWKDHIGHNISVVPANTKK